MNQIRKDLSLLLIIFFLVGISFFSGGVLRAMAYGGIIGSIIGWSTNWAVIQMLFRPRNPVKVLWFSWSGLLIKKKPELAKKIGEVVENDLITKEKILERIDKAKPVVYDKIEEKVLELTKTQFGTFKEVSGERFYPVIEEGRKRLVQDTSPVIEKKLFSQETVMWVSKEVVRLLKYYMNTPMVYVIGTERIDSIIESILKIIKGMDESRRNEIILNISKYFYDQISVHSKDIEIKLKEAFARNDAAFLDDISNDVLSFAHEWIGREENRNIVRDGIAPFLNRISDSIEESGGFVTWFIDVKQKINEIMDSHWDTVIETVSLKLRQKDTALFVTSKMKEMFPGIVGRLDVSRLIGSDVFRELFEQALLSTGSNFIKMIDSEEFIRKLRVKAYVVLERPFSDIVPDWEKRAEKILFYAADQYIDTLSTRRISPVQEILDRLSEKALTEYRIGIVGEKLTADNRNALINGATDIVFQWLKSNMPDIVDNNLRIGEMVESEINNFSNEELEKTIKAVVNDELGTIVRLGGYLGIVAGAASQFVIFMIG